MTTKRTPVRPPGGTRITPAAVAAFREMQRLEESCDCQHRCKDGDCKKWDEQNDILRHAMDLPPWEWPGRTSDRTAVAVMPMQWLAIAC